MIMGGTFQEVTRGDLRWTSPVWWGESILYLRWSSLWGSLTWSRCEYTTYRVRPSSETTATTWFHKSIIVITEVDFVHFYELKWNFGRALENDDVYEEWKMIQQEYLLTPNAMWLTELVIYCKFFSDNKIKYVCLSMYVQICPGW